MDKDKEKDLVKAAEHIRKIGENMANLSNLIKKSEHGELIQEIMEDHYPFDKPLNELHGNIWSAYFGTKIAELIKDEVKIPVTYGLIKNSVGWSRFCDVTGGNHYAMKEYGELEDNAILDVKKSHARELGFIK